MKLTFITMLCLFSVNIFATDFLSSSERDEVVTAIDNICADTWCEGEYDFSFASFNCSAEDAKCTLSFDLVYVRWDDNYENSTSSTFHAQCTVTNLHTLSDILYSPAYEKFSYYELTQSFYDNLSDCISQKEEEAENYFAQTANALF